MTVTEASIVDKTMLVVSKAAVTNPVEVKTTRRILSVFVDAIAPELGSEL
jgi:hypothetical protein